MCLLGVCVNICDDGLIFHLFLFIIFFLSFFVGEGMIDWLVGLFVHRIDFLLVYSNYYVGSRYMYVFLNCSVFYESNCTLLFNVKSRFAYMHALIIFSNIFYDVLLKQFYTMFNSVYLHASQ